MEKLDLSLVVITLNEEKNIERCLKSVPFAREVIVLDSKSKDRTVDIAQSLGARVFSQEFKGYRQQKADALALATQSWILSLDADEYLSPNLQTEIKSVLTNPLFNGYKMPRKSFHLGRWIYHGDWYPDFQTRLIKRNRAYWKGGQLHESMFVEGKVGTLEGEIYHNVFRDLADQIDTNNEYSTLGANDAYQSGRKFYSWQLLLKPIFKFLECYLWKLGFLDGAPGFIIALAAAQSSFLKYSKLWELTESKNNH